MYGNVRKVHNGCRRSTSTMFMYERLKISQSTTGCKMCCLLQCIYSDDHRSNSATSSRVINGFRCKDSWSVYTTRPLTRRAHRNVRRVAATCARESSDVKILMNALDSINIYHPAFGTEVSHTRENDNFYFRS